MVCVVSQHLLLNYRCLCVYSHCEKVRVSAVYYTPVQILQEFYVSIHWKYTENTVVRATTTAIDHDEAPHRYQKARVKDALRLRQWSRPVEKVFAQEVRKMRL